MFYGGNQEFGLRSGTENTPMIAGLGMACQLIDENLHIYSSNMKKTRTYLERQIKVIAFISIFSKSFIMEFFLQKIFGNFVKINCVDPCFINDPEECARPPNGPKRNHVVFPRLPNTVSVSFYYPEVHFKFETHSIFI